MRHAVAIAALQECGDLAAGKRLHSSLLQQRRSLPLAVANSLITMYARCGSTADARHVFESMRRRSVVSWNALLFGYFRSGETSLALELFRRMLHDDPQGLAPNSLTYVAVLNACSCCCESRTRSQGRQIEIELLEAGRSIHSHASKSGMDHTDLKLASSLIDMYAKCGSIASALQVFERIDLPDAVCWNAIIMGCAQGGRPELALELFSRMEGQSKDGGGGIVPDAWTFAAAIKSCSMLGTLEPARQIDGKLVRVSSLDRGMDIHSRMQRDAKLESDIFVANAVLDMYAKCGSMIDARRYFQFRMRLHDVVSWNTIIQGCIDDDEPRLALEFYLLLLELGKVVPNDITVRAALQACGALGDLEAGRGIHDALPGRGTGITTLETALVDFYGKCGSMTEAQQIFDSMSAKDTVAWNALISGYARAGDTDRVLVLFQKMEKGRVAIDGVTFLSVLTACSHGGRVPEGKNFFRRMCSEFKIVPGAEHYCCMADLLGRANHLDEAVEMLRRHPSSESVVNGWRSLLAASSRWRNVAVGEAAFESVMKVDAQDVAAYVLMANLYASTGMWDKSAALHAQRKQIQSC